MCIILRNPNSGTVTDGANETNHGGPPLRNQCGLQTQGNIFT